MRRTVVILLSDKRSGSTIFEKELCKHPGVNHVAYTPHTYFETHHWLKAACILGAPRPLFHGRQVYDGYGSRRGAREYMIDCIRGNVPDFATPDNDEALVFEGWDALCRTFARPVFFEKSPQHPHHWAALDLMLHWAKTTDYTVRFIGLIRNPMAVMYSALEKFFTDPAERQFGWASCCRNMLAVKGIVGEERFQVVRYEDVIHRPGRTFGEVLDWLELDRHEGIGDGIHARSLNKWREDPAFTLRLHDSVVRMAEHFGYEKREMYNPPKPGLSAKERIRRKARKILILNSARIRDRVATPILLGMRRLKKERHGDNQKGR